MAQLTREQLEGLRRWQRYMVTSFVTAMVALIGLLVLELTVDIPPSFEPYATVIVVLLLGTVAGVQFSERCPSCGARIGLQSALVLPPCCARCGASFREPGRNS